MTESAFDQNHPKEDEVAPAILSPDADLLKTIVDESGRPKYDSVEKALKALAHSQAHIKQLEAERAAEQTELSTIRERAAQADALEAVIERLQPNASPAAPKPTPSSAGLSEEATIKQLEQIIEKRERAKIASKNFQDVNNQLLAKFGGDIEKTRAAVAAKAKELDMSVEDLAALSSKSPKAVLSYFGETPKGTPQPTVPSQTSFPTPKGDEPLKPPEKSLLLGATSKDQRAYMEKIKAEVYKRHGIET